MGVGVGGGVVGVDLLRVHFVRARDGEDLFTVEDGRVGGERPEGLVGDVALPAHLAQLPVVAALLVEAVLEHRRLDGRLLL